MRHANAGHDVFARLMTAWHSGRPIVPLFGAGISACASIPFGPHIVEYLTGVKLLHELVAWPASCAEYLTARGWPDMNELNAELAARCGPDLSLQLERVRAELARLPSAEASVPHWLSLIHQISDGCDS